ALQAAALLFTPAAEADLARSLVGGPGDAEVLRALGEGCAAGRRWEEADAWYTRLVELRPDDPEGWLGRGRLRLEAAREDRALRAAAAADLREAVRLRPDSYDARLLLAQALLSDAAVAEAGEHFDACLRLRPDRPEPLVGLAACAVEGRAWG